jgi:NAD(P)-dependent dehydrogenase (short-subunit alcohol dehydrogenase family)
VTRGRLQDKTILIVGGTSGLGLSAANACLIAGANVVVVGRDADKCRSATESKGDRIRAVIGDAVLPDTAERAVRTAIDGYGGLHGLYHVAGGSGRRFGDGPLDAITDEGWQYTLRTNLDSLFYSNRAAIRYWMTVKSPGAVLNMASVLGFAPSRHYFATHAYAAAKAAAIGLTKSTAAYYAPHGIRVNAVAPSLMETPMAKRAQADEEIMQFVATKQPLARGRMGQPSDLDDAVIYFLSDESRMVTGQVLAIDGGWCVSDGQLPKGEANAS